MTFIYYNAVALLGKSTKNGWQIGVPSEHTGESPNGHVSGKNPKEYAKPNRTIKRFTQIG